MEKQENAMSFLEDGKTKTSDEDEKREREMKKRAGKKEKKGGPAGKGKKEGGPNNLPLLSSKGHAVLSLEDHPLKRR